MKICIVALNIVPYFRNQTGGRFGGAEVQAAVLARAFGAAGTDVELVVTDLEEGRTLPFPAHNAYFNRSGVPVFRFLHPRTTGLLDALERANADVYFQHCAGVVSGLTSWFCKKNGRPFVYFAGSDSDFSWRDVVIGNPRDKLIYFWGLKNAAGIVAQNETQAQLCRDRLQRDCRVIPTTVDPAGREGHDEDGSVVWIGGFRAVKNPERFLELARRIPDRRFVMIGGKLPGNPSLGDRILRESADIPNLSTTGFIPSRDVYGYLARASLLVNTSAWEGFPNAFLEAWARNTPVVSFVDVDGLIAGEGAGVICGTLDDMTGLVRRLLDDPDERRRLGQNARRLIETRYNSAVTARQHLDYFDHILSGRR